MLIDSHAHLTHVKLFKDIDLILARAQALGIEKIINICTNPKELSLGLTLSSQYPWVYNAAATTPHEVQKEAEQFFELVMQNVDTQSLIAIGETGLDYYYWKESMDDQKKLLSRYLKLAADNGLPIVIHCRDAFQDLFRILDKEKPVSGVLHCFTGTLAEAKELIARDWYISLSGIVTFKNSEELCEVARSIPLNRLLIETDAPYLAPMPYRGKINEPSYLIETAKFLAEIRKISFAEFAMATSRNGETLFKLNSQ